MSFSGHICKKRDIEYGSAVANYDSERLYFVFKEIDEKLTNEQKNKYLFRESVILWSDEAGSDFEIDPKILYSLFEEKELENLLDFLNEKEKNWLKILYNDIKNDKEYHLNNNYIRIDFF